MLQCPICRGRTTDLAVRGASGLVICERCRHVTWKNMPTETELAEFYSTTYAGPHLQESTQQANIPYYRRHVEQLRIWAEAYMVNRRISA